MESFWGDLVKGNLHSTIDIMSLPPVLSSLCRDTVRNETFLHLEWVQSLRSQKMSKKGTHSGVTHNLFQFLLSLNSHSRSFQGSSQYQHKAPEEERETPSPITLTSLRDFHIHSGGIPMWGIFSHDSIRHFPFLCIGRKQDHRLSLLQRIFSLRRKKKWMDSS
jgi:hypothetical protein